MIDGKVTQPTLFHDGKVALYGGDCMAILDQLEPNSLDAVCSDPPYHLTSIVARFGGKGAAPAISNGPTGVYARASGGFMGQQWDGGDIAFQVALWRKILRALKPGGWVIAFSATRTYHRMVCAAEDAGFEVRDMIPWLYGSGFPKSLDISKAIDKRQGCAAAAAVSRAPAHCNSNERERPSGSTEAKQWDGWGTALKPALEPAMLARKPTALTYADNVLQFGVGGLNIDGCRIPIATMPAERIDGGKKGARGVFSNSKAYDYYPDANGRWPANVIHDGSDTVAQHFNERDVADALAFFYSAKADAADRLGSKHPTVKPLDLMRYLVRLITPPGGLVLDMFAGTGTTGEAALAEGMRAILIEREAQYQTDIANRMAFAGMNRALRIAHHTSQRPPRPNKAELAGQTALFDIEESA
eukprot:NODE_1_length_16519_cov_5.649970_g0_i0.p2 GENE.NODE_1_length_16519_cov_5.649970_g0_i0~~NODE_1_length_16519_cov_5.649970_g0_i0.p2  ORF type:complete len:415 (-),score=121.90 NODE_1_length_16519_cov_5.649970_g0_i0:7020-8264(-)